MKAITALAAAALLFGVTAASAQAPSSSASKPGATVNTDKEVPAVAGNKAIDKNAAGMTAPKSTTGSGSASGLTGGTSPNPSSNKNPDTEVPGKKVQ